MPWESSVNNSVASNWGSGSLELLCLFLFEMHRHHHGGSWVIPVMRFEMLNYIWFMLMVKTFHSSTFKLQSEITALVNYLWCQIGVSLPAPSVNDSSPEFTIYSCHYCVPIPNVFTVNMKETPKSNNNSNKPNRKCKTLHPSYAGRFFPSLWYSQINTLCGGVEPMGSDMSLG